MRKTQQGGTKMEEKEKELFPSPHGEKVIKS